MAQNTLPLSEELGEIELSTSSVLAVLTHNTLPLSEEYQLQTYLLD